MLKRLWRTDAPLTVTGILMLPALAMAAVGLLVDPRLITGAPAWLKPAKFALSIAVYVFTLAWMFTSIPGFRRTRRVVGWVTAIVMVLELAVIDLQAWRGTTSHFNFSTPYLDRRPAEGAVGTTACAFGRDADDRDVLCVTTSGGLWMPYQGLVQEARLLRLAVGEAGQAIEP
jgi:hypothetical protein